MTDVQISGGVWQAAGDGSLRATFEVAWGDATAQPVTAFVDPESRAELGLPLDEGLADVAPELTARARAAIEHLATTGRSSPELRLTRLDLAGVLGGDGDEDRDTSTPDEPGPEA
ncbi:hypothetical protein KSP35_21550 [Aquihabitans sp. G128]|uniref:hypothetical protein n=1 Tax=Aquihabitans sp. G128 TaxID=2849779 RepID=UPI001C221675|nr:hypothetical protein [Aquihabitans sp. G128]QXC60874.1 hypothetical protein KSP35_21550 [Aquihabitans sp. G128]